MANICSTEIAITTSTPELAEKLYDEMEKALSEKDNPKWIGNLLIHIGYKEGEFPDDVSTRGNICDFEQFNSKMVCIYTDTAWTPCLQAFVLFANKIIGEGNYEIRYTTEEPGCEIFCTNAPEMIGAYWVDYDCDKFHKVFGGDRYFDAEELRKILKEYIKTPNLSLDEMIKQALSNDDDEWLSIHEYKEVPVSDWS